MKLYIGSLFAQVHGSARFSEVPTLWLDLVRPHRHTRSNCSGCYKFFKRSTKFVILPHNQY